jgi:hypothetical protein
LFDYNYEVLRTVSLSWPLGHLRLVGSSARGKTEQDLLSHSEDVSERKIYFGTLLTCLIRTGDISLNGQKVEIVNSILGVYPGVQTAARVYPVANQNKPGRSSLHTLPIGIVDHVLGLNGSDGLYTLVDAVNIPPANDLFYDEFILRGGLVNHDITGRWVAFPGGGGWEIKRYDGRSHISGSNPYI